MNTLLTLQNQAILAAKNQQWTDAIAVNLQILDIENNNVPALNRLGVAYLQNSDPAAAKKIFHQVLDLDASNVIARKQLTNIDKNQSTAPNFTSQHFIEEPSKSKIVPLHHLAPKTTLAKLVVGQPLMLKTKSRFISVETEQKVTVGSLPDDISLRLSKLISTGNKYQCLVHSFSYNSCLVYIREIFVALGNEGKLPFPPIKSLSSADLGDEWFIENDLPIDTGEESDDTSENKIGFSTADIGDDEDK